MEREEGSAYPSHTCVDRQDILQALLSQGITLPQIIYPDCGRGRQRWENAGFEWRDAQRTLMGVRGAEAMMELANLNIDPLAHSAVVANHAT